MNKLKCDLHVLLIWTVWTTVLASEFEGSIPMSCISPPSRGSRSSWVTWPLLDKLLKCFWTICSRSLDFKKYFFIHPSIGQWYAIFSTFWFSCRFMWTFRLVLATNFAEHPVRILKAVSLVYQIFLSCKLLQATFSSLYKFNCTKLKSYLPQDRQKVSFHCV